MSKFFDIHIEVGDVQPGIFYAKTILGNNSIKVEHHGPSPAAAVNLVVQEMEQAGFWAIIVNNPSMTPYPFPTTPRAVNSHGSAPAPPTKKDAIKEQPSYLAGTPKGQCEAVCLSFENFGSSRCNTSVCANKK